MLGKVIGRETARGKNRAGIKLAVCFMLAWPCFMITKLLQMHVIGLKWLC